jgi:hypothetical protein
MNFLVESLTMGGAGPHGLLAPIGFALGVAVLSVLGLVLASKVLVGHPRRFARAKL